MNRILLLIVSLSLPVAPARNCDTWKAQRIKENKFVEEALESTNFTRLSLSKSSAHQFFHDMRGYGKSEYTALMDNLKIFTCQETSTESHKRQVPCTGTNVAKDWKNKPIYASDFSGISGVDCEVAENCYWKAVVPGQKRVRKYTSGDYTKAKTAIEEFVMDTVKIILLPIILFVLTILYFLVSMCCFFWKCIVAIARKCCCKDACACECWDNCKKKCNIKCPISTKQLRLVYCFLFVGCCGAIVGIGFVAKGANGTLSSGQTVTFKTTGTCLDDFSKFMTTSKGPLYNILQAVSGAVAGINAKLNPESTSFIKKELDGVANRMEDFNRIYGSIIAFPKGCSIGDASCIECSFCKTVKTSIDSAINMFRTEIDPVTSALTSTIDGLNEGLVSEEQILKDLVTKNLNSTDEVINEAVPQLRKRVDNLEKFDKETSGHRENGVLAIFGISLILAFIGSMGVVAGFTHCKYDDFLHYNLYFTWFLGCIVSFVGFAISAVIILMALLLNDVCECTDILVEDFKPYVGPESAKGLNACFNNTPLVQAYNLSHNFDPITQLEQKFAVVDDLNIASSFTQATKEIYDMADEISKLDKKTLGADEAVDNFNKVSASCPSPADIGYTVENFYTPWQANNEEAYGNGPYPNLNDANAYMQDRYQNEMCQPVYGLYGTTSESFWSMDKTFYGMKVDMGYLSSNGNAAPDLTTKDSTAYDYSAAKNEKFLHSTSTVQHAKIFESNLLKLQSDVQVISKTAVNDVIGYVGDFSCLTCNWIVPCYQRMKDNLCSTWLSAFFTVASCIFAGSFINLTITLLALALARIMRQPTTVEPEKALAEVLPSANQESTEVAGAGNDNDAVSEFKGPNLSVLGGGVTGDQVSKKEHSPNATVPLQVVVESGNSEKENARNSKVKKKAGELAVTVNDSNDEQKKGDDEKQKKGGDENGDEKQKKDDKKNDEQEKNSDDNDKKDDEQEKNGDTKNDQQQKKDNDSNKNVVPQ